MRKSDRGSWSTANIKVALEALSDGMPLKTCAVQFGIPRNTLRRHWTKALKKAPGDGKLGKPTMLGDKVEQELVEYILALEDRGFGLTPKDVRSLVFDYAEQNNIPNNFNKMDRMAGLDWWAGFRLRHHSMLSIRKPEALSLSRAQCMNQPAVSKYFDILDSEMKKLGLTDKPACIYNCDESGLSLVPDVQKIVGRKGKRNVYQITSGERGVLTTVLPCYNAAGDYIPPMVIYKGKRLVDGLKANMPPGSLVCVSESGYMHKELFETWLKHFKKHLKHPDLPAILILDGHGSHVKALDALKFASKNNISIICLPPHTTHWTQPQDKCFFKPLKMHFADECRKFMRKKPGQGITRLSFGSLFTPAYNKTASIHVAVESFRVTGIFPFNRHIFPESAFSPAATTSRSMSENVVGRVDRNEENLPHGESPAISAVSLDQPEMQSSAVDGPTTDTRELTAAADQCDGNELRSHELTCVHHENNLPSTGELEDETCEHAGLSTVSNVVSCDDSTNDKNCTNTFECVLPIPQKQFDEHANTTKRKSRATTSRVLTSKAHLASLANELHQSAKEPPQKKMKHDKGIGLNLPKENKTKQKEKKTAESSRKKKKMTCRADKRPGPKPKNRPVCQQTVGLKLPASKKATVKSVSQRWKTTCKSKSSRGPSSAAQDDTTTCGGCGELWLESTEEWIQCTGCEEWYEISCAGMTGKAKCVQDQFMCLDCVAN